MHILSWQIFATNGKNGFGVLLHVIANIRSFAAPSSWTVSFESDSSRVAIIAAVIEWRYRTRSASELCWTLGKELCARRSEVNELDCPIEKIQLFAGENAD